MSKEREVTVIGAAGGSETRALTDEEIAAQRAEKRARFARILERGFLADRLTVENLPPHLHGEWVPKDPMEVERKKALGFYVDTEYATTRALHSDGSTGQAIVGDCIFMVCAKEDKELIDELRYDQYIKMHGSPGEQEALTQREEQGFKSLVSTIKDTALPVIEESHARTARKEELEAALKAVEKP